MLTVPRALCVCVCVCQNCDAGHRLQPSSGTWTPYSPVDDRTPSRVPGSGWFNPVLTLVVPRDKSRWIKCCHCCICRGASSGWLGELRLCTLWKSGALPSIDAQEMIPRLALLLLHRLQWPCSVHGSFSPAKQLSFILLHCNMWFRDDSSLLFEPGLGYYPAFQPNIIRNVDVSTQGHFLQN